MCVSELSSKNISRRNFRGRDAKLSTALSPQEVSPPHLTFIYLEICPGHIRQRSLPISISSPDGEHRHLDATFNKKNTHNCNCINSVSRGGKKKKKKEEEQIKFLILTQTDKASIQAFPSKADTELSTEAALPCTPQVKSSCSAHPGTAVMGRWLLHSLSSQVFSSLPDSTILRAVRCPQVRPCAPRAPSQSCTSHSTRCIPGRGPSKDEITAISAEGLPALEAALA